MAKNTVRVMCPQLGRAKFLFDSEQRAEAFIKFNESNLLSKRDLAKGVVLRVYYCESCRGYHFTRKRTVSKRTVQRQQAIDEQVTTSLKKYKPYKNREGNLVFDPKRAALRDKFIALINNESEIEKIYATKELNLDPKWKFSDYEICCLHSVKKYVRRNKITFREGLKRVLRQEGIFDV